MTHKAYQTGVAHVNNTELYYEVVGSGHPLTLIHGMLLDRRSWDDQFEVFARQDLSARPLGRRYARTRFHAGASRHCGRADPGRIGTLWVSAAHD